MKILFDQGTPAPLRRELPGHTISTTAELGWSDLSNGTLLRTADGAFEAFITTDQSIRHQQNLSGIKLAILVLPTTSWPRIQQHIAEIVGAVTALRPGDFVELTFSA